MKAKLENLKQKLVLKHAEVVGGGFKRDAGISQTVELVVLVIGGLIVATFVIFKMRGITADTIMPGFESNVSTLFDNITTGN